MWTTNATPARADSGPVAGRSMAGTGVRGRGVGACVETSDFGGPMLHSSPGGGAARLACSRGDGWGRCAARLVAGCRLAVRRLPVEDVEDLGGEGGRRG